jgi:hypothetical protein
MVMAQPLRKECHFFVRRAPKGAKSEKPRGLPRGSHRRGIMRNGLPSGVAAYSSRPAKLTELACGPSNPCSSAKRTRAPTGSLSNPGGSSTELRWK